LLLTSSSVSYDREIGEKRKDRLSIKGESGDSKSDTSLKSGGHPIIFFFLVSISSDITVVFYLDILTNKISTTTKKRATVVLWVARPQRKNRQQKKGHSKCCGWPVHKEKKTE
jgi:hypothetical protein